MPIPALVGLGIASSAGTVAGSAIAAHGQASAANTQAQSDANALAAQKAMFGTALQANAPYMAAGAGALGQLNSLLGITPNYGAVPANPFTPGGSEDQQTITNLEQNPTLQRLNKTHSWNLQQLAVNLGNQQGALNGAQPPPGGATPGMVQMRAPDGSTASVPQDQVQAFIGKGAIPIVS